MLYMKIMYRTLNKLIYIILITSTPILFSHDIFLEASGGYYHPTGSRFKNIYSGTGIYEVQGKFKAYENLYPRFGIGYLFASGKSLGGCVAATSHLHMVPFTLGVDYHLPFKKKIFYGGIGFPITYVHIHNKYKYVERRSSWGVGVTPRLGMISYFTERFFFDFFTSYTYLKVSFSSPSSRKHLITQSADLSGFTFGGGLGYHF